MMKNFLRSIGYKEVSNNRLIGKYIIEIRNNLVYVYHKGNKLFEGSKVDAAKFLFKV